MSALPVETVKSRLENVIALARLLERVERSGNPPSADQYQALVHSLKNALSQTMPHDALQAVLGAHPASAELYENMHYAESGLSQAPLERSVNSELLASQLLARAARKG